MKALILTEEVAQRIYDYIFNCKTIREPMHPILALLTPTELPNDAKEAVKKLRGQIIGNPTAYWLSDSEAAALITAYGRQVPRAMLVEMWQAGFDWAKGEDQPEQIENVIAAKHGYTVKE